MPSGTVCEGGLMKIEAALAEKAPAIRPIAITEVAMNLKIFVLCM
jgi:hypothetical protein